MNRPAPSLSTGWWDETAATLRLALPIVAGALLQNSLGVIDTLMVGQVSVTGVAAASFAGGIFSVPLIFGFGLLGFISVYVARARGRGDFHEAAAILRRGLGLSLALAALIALVVTLLCAELDRFHEPPEVTAQARSFLLLLIWSLVPVYLVQTLKQYCEALGRPAVPMCFLLGSVAVNVALNWLFIYGHAGLPALGLLGAGWATLITRSAMGLGLGFYVWRTLLPRDPPPADTPREPWWRACWPMLSFGLPVGVQIIFEVGAFSAAAVMMGWISREALAAHQIAMSLVSTVFMLPMGLSSALAIRLSHAVGAGEEARGRRLAHGAHALTAVVMVAVAGLMLAGRRAYGEAFVHDAAVVDLTARILFIAAFMMIFDGLQVVSVGALRGLHDLAVPTLANFAAYWVIALPLGFLAAFPGRLGATGIWLGLLAGMLFVCAMHAWRLHRQLGRHHAPRPSDALAAAVDVTP